MATLDIEKVKQNLWNKISGESITKTELATILRPILEMIGASKAEMRSFVEQTRQLYANLLDSQGKRHDGLMADLKKQVDALFIGQKFDQMKKEHGNMLSELRTKMGQVKNGRTPKKGVDYFDGRPGKDGRLMTPDEVVSKINLSEVLIQADKIEGLADLNKKVDMATKQGGRRVLAGPNANAIQIANVTSQCNGSNRTFYIPTARQIHIVFSHEAPFFYFPGTHFTIGRNSITLLNNVAAPESGQGLGVFYTK